MLCNKKKKTNAEREREEQSVAKPRSRNLASPRFQLVLMRGPVLLELSCRDRTLFLGKVTMAEISREKPEGERIPWKETKSQSQRKRERERERERSQREKDRGIASREAVRQREGRKREFFRVYVDVSTVRIGERALN